MGSGIAYGHGRQALLEAAIRVVAAEGLRGLTYRSLAAEAGVTHGSVRYHFGNWASMLEEALTYSASRSVGEAVLRSDGPGFDDFAAGLIGMVSGAPEVQAFQYEVSLESRRRPELRAVMERVNDTYRAGVQRELIRNGLEDPGLAEAIFMLLDGVVFHQTVFGETQRSEQALRALRSLLRAYAAQAPA